MRLQVCDYCDSKNPYHVHCETRLHGILACTFHRHLAERDVCAWFRRHGLVRQKDFLNRHPEVTSISINVPRSQGPPTPNGNISEEPWQFLQKMEGQWVIYVLFKEPTGELKNKYVKLTDFDQSGVYDDTIQEWLTTLDDFYKEEEELNTYAVQAGREKETPIIPGIAPVYSNGVVVGQVIMTPDESL